MGHADAINAAPPRGNYIDGYPLYPTSAVQHLTRMWHEENTLLFAPLPCLGVNRPIIGIAQVDEPTALFCNAGRQRDRDTRCFDVVCGIVGTRSLDVRAMC